MPATIPASYPYPVQPNNSAAHGQLAGRKFLFGAYSRYAIAPVHTRFGELTWFVWDAAMKDTPIIRQEPTFDSAVRGLDPELPPAPFPVLFAHGF